MACTASSASVLSDVVAVVVTVMLLVLPLACLNCVQSQRASLCSTPFNHSSGHFRFTPPPEDHLSDSGTRVQATSRVEAKSSSSVGVRLHGPCPSKNSSFLQLA